MILTVLTGVIVAGNLVIPSIPKPDVCEIRSNYVDHVVEQIKEGKTLMHASMLELSKTGKPDITKRLYSVVDIKKYSEGFELKQRLEDLAIEIKKECI